MHSLTRTALHPDSYLGRRVATSVAAIKTLDLETRMAGFEQRPGEHPFLGEHVGKWIDAASGFWLASGDETLKSTLDATVARLISTQDSDGYLGTYEPALRYTAGFGAAWDLWTSKYTILGLVHYHQATGDSDAIVAARRLADLVVSRFRPDGHIILRTDTHGGLASASILIAFTRLYAATGEAAYLEFAEHLLAELDSDAGPRLRPTLLTTGRVSQVGNGKSYEMLSCIHGMLELGQLTADEDSVRAAVAAWEDVRDNHLYVTGTASFGEHFHLPGDLPASESANMGETCVTTTWIQLSAALYEHTGESRYLEEAERSLFNQLAAASHPDASWWCYYLPLQGRRDYRIGIECCSSSGPRAVALGQSLLFAIDGDELVVGLYQAGTSQADVGGGRVGLEMHSDVPFGGEVTLVIEPELSAHFGLRLRRPAWATTMLVDGIEIADRDGWVQVPAQTWTGRSEVSIHLGTEVRTVAGHGWNAGRVAYTQGPLVLAYSPSSPRPSVAPAMAPRRLSDASPVTHQVGHPDVPSEELEVQFLPFAEAGYAGDEYRVWLSTARDDREPSLFRSGIESRSGRAHLPGSAIDGDPDTAIDSFGSGGSGEDSLDWVAVELPTPVTFRRVVLAAGIDATTAGWFDTILVMPEVQVRHEPGGPWHTIAVIHDYPPTSTVDDGGVRPGQRFELVLDAPVTASGLRVRGVGSWGHVQFARRISISELAAFAH